MAIKRLRRGSRAAPLALCLVVSSPVSAQTQKPDGHAFVELGEFRVSVGGKQPGFKGTADAATTSFVEESFTVVGALTEVKR